MCTDFALLGGRYMAACVEVRICSVCALATDIAMYI